MTAGPRVNRPLSLLWPLLVGALSLALTAWLWQHERRAEVRHLQDNFDFALRQTAIRVEQRMASYEQMLRGTRGLFEASDHVSRGDFSAYVDALLSGADFVGLRLIAFSPLLQAEQVPAHVTAQRAGGAADYEIRPAGTRDLFAPVTYAAPSNLRRPGVLGVDPLADPARRAALLLSRDSGSITITSRLVPADPRDSQAESIFVMFMPVYHRGRVVDTPAERRAHLLGWVMASFRVSDLMSSLYGESTPGLDVRIYDGIEISDATRMYPAVLSAGDTRPAQFEAREYIGFAGHTWTLQVRSRPDFEHRYSSDSARIIAIAGSGLSVALALLTWLLVTGRERATAAARAMTRQLRDSAERYRRIVETADEGIWTVDGDGRTSFANPKLQRWLGYDEAQMLGRPFGDFTDAAGRAALDRPGTQQPEIRLHRSDGSDAWATLSTSAITDADGRPAGVLAMVTDVTERRLAEARRLGLEAQLRQSQKMEAIGTLAGGIAHDFNNILAAILGNVSLLRSELAPGHAAAERLGQIGQAADRARSLVQQIVAFSRQQPQALVVQPLRPLLDEAVALLRSTLPARVELEARFGAAPLQIGADATQLQQVLMNLCTNAWHALGGQPGRIVIGLAAVTLDAEAAQRLGGVAAGPHAHLWVNDNGCGMDEATRLRVFEPFFTTKPVGQGTGLGLSVVHGIVTSHRGAITVRSAPGAGSCFDMYFPLADAATPAQPRPEAGALLHGRGEHVMVVDDDPVMVLMVEGLLLRWGYRVSCFSDAGAALDRLRSAAADYDVVVTDFNMPGMSGLDLALELRGICPELPVILSSGFVSDSLRADVALAGVRQVIQKEYTLEQLGAAVQRALAQRQDR